MVTYYLLVDVVPQRLAYTGLTRLICDADKLMFSLFLSTSPWFLEISNPFSSSLISMTSLNVSCTTSNYWGFLMTFQNDLLSPRFVRCIHVYETKGVSLIIIWCRNDKILHKWFKETTLNILRQSRHRRLVLKFQ